MADGMDGILPRDLTAKICVVPVNLSSIREGGTTKTTTSIARARHNPNVFKIIT
jgi:hypothetical protein